MSLTKHLINMGCAICTPVPYVGGPDGPRLAPVTTEWHRARLGLATPTNINTMNVNVDGMEVGAARCRAVDLCMEHDPFPPEFLFFLDYDVIVPFDAITKLLYRARHFPDHDIFAGVYVCKSSPAEPLIYKGDGHGPYWDWSVGDLITEGITGTHMGLTLIRTSLFAKMKWSDDEPLFLTVNEQHVDSDGMHTLHGTEDLHFCKLARDQADARILVDTGVLAGHINNATGKIYGLPQDSKPVMGADWIDPSKKKRRQKKVIDIGAGDRRRSWPGYTTYTSDIRDDVGADYVQDTRKLTLPDDYFDMVASSHHLEHIGRWEQDELWREMFRITKPGGCCEHTIPNIAWAAGRIYDGQEDVHTMNVLYGAQEAHGYRREFNTHYFGYTPQIAEALAVGAGYVDVKVETYKDRPELGYELIVTGTKPKAKAKAKVKPKTKAAQTAKPNKTRKSALTPEEQAQIDDATENAKSLKITPAVKDVPITADSGCHFGEVVCGKAYDVYFERCENHADGYRAFCKDAQGATVAAVGMTIDAAIASWKRRITHIAQPEAQEASA